MVWRGDNTARVARSVLKLFDQLDQAFPNRSRLSDGTIGDAAHRAEGDASDHNPWYPKPNGGIVTAGDYTHDPAHGVDIDRLSDELAASRDPRIKYVIANGLILDTRAQFNPWKWMPYRGADSHTNHLHLSVMDSPICDNDTPWNLPMLKGSDMPSPSDLWNAQIVDPYPNAVPKSAATMLGWAAAHAALARGELAIKVAEIEAKLDTILAKLNK